MRISGIEVEIVIVFEDIDQFGRLAPDKSVGDNALELLRRYKSVSRSGPTRRSRIAPKV